MLSPMPIRARGRTVLVAVFACAFGLAVGFAAAKSTYPPVEVLLQSGETVIGQKIAYPASPCGLRRACPEGAPQVTAAIVTMEPGAATGPHRHDAPLFAYMLAGELTVDYGADGRRVYRAGDAFLEAFRTVHDGTNTGDEPARVLAVFIGAEGVENTVAE